MKKRTLENTLYLHFTQYINKISPFSIPDLFLAFLLIYDTFTHTRHPVETKRTTHHTPRYILS